MRIHGKQQKLHIWYRARKTWLYNMLQHPAEAV
jgi:hypothetical protein